MSAAPHVPAPDDRTEDWWAATRTGVLLLQHCRSCGRLQHPPRAVCAGCGRLDALDWQVAAGAGAVDACTVVHRSPGPGFEPPYLIARIRLAEGPILLSTVPSTDSESVAIGDPVRLDWQALPDGRALPVFVPVAEET